MSERTGNHIKIIDGSLGGQDTKTNHAVFDSARRGRSSFNQKESNTDLQSTLTNNPAIEKQYQTKAFSGIKSNTSIRELLTKYSQNKDESPDNPLHAENSFLIVDIMDRFSMLK